MNRSRRLQGLVAAAALAAMAMGAGQGTDATQPAAWTCPAYAPAAPADGFASGGIGLTCREWVARYGEPDEISQNEAVYVIGGIRVTGMGSSGLRLQFEDGAWQQDGTFPNEFLAAMGFLPEDADHLGIAGLGTGLNSDQIAAIHVSPSLAERNKAMRFPAPGAILVVFTYAEDGSRWGLIETVELIQTVARG